jgi:tryptophan synthase alpha chain
LQSCKEAGVDGLILPDLPLFEFDTIYGNTIKENGLDFIFLVTPETSEERLRKLDNLSTGFLYAVSSSATTGKDKDFSKVALYLKRLKAFGLKNPFLVGFGIKDKESFNAVNEYANGAIIGSAYIKALSSGADINAITKTFLSSILQ